MRCAASRWLRAFRASTGGERHTRSQVSRRTLIVPSVGSGEGGGERVMRSPSKVTLRRCTVPVKLWFQEMSQWWMTSLSPHS